MAYSGLNEFIARLETEGELKRIKSFFNPSLEITEIADRITKVNGPALLFENTGTDFPLLINAFGSDNRMTRALGRNSLEEAGNDIEKLFSKLTAKPGSVFSSIGKLPEFLRIASLLPSRSDKKKARCRQVIHNNPDLGILPTLKCWPFDGGRFITLPVVHTCNPFTGQTNAGMYRMQVLDKNTTGMHWQMHKTGAAHFREWKKAGKKMPVSVILGGDPVYTYAATAPLPENIDEYILAGFLRRRKVKLVKCLTNDLYVPEDADFVIEGYVDPAEDLVWEGPFGDHTGFYSLADWYPKFHVTCITHANDAVYPATIVGVPPQEDAFLAKATEKIFLTPIKLTLQPEVQDLHMPDAGVAHNLAIVKIRKNYPGQGMKVLSSLLGAGQMMFTKYMVVVSGDVNIRDYASLTSHILRNTDPLKDILFLRGPLDVLDHSSDSFAFGGKAGIDATIKIAGESLTPDVIHSEAFNMFLSLLDDMKREDLLTDFYSLLTGYKLPVYIASVKNSGQKYLPLSVIERIRKADLPELNGLLLIVEDGFDIKDVFLATWQVLGNTDPFRDHTFIGKLLVIDASIKAFRPGGFPRKWPNVVCSSEQTVSAVEDKWRLSETDLLPGSPSAGYRGLLRKGEDEIINS